MVRHLQSFSVLNTNLLEKGPSYTEINIILTRKSTESIAIITADNTLIHIFVYIAAFEE